MARDLTLIRNELGNAQKKALEAEEKGAAPSKRYDLTKQVKALRQELSDGISEGSNSCPDCGAMPIGLRHIHVSFPNGVKREIHSFEVGCPVCKDHRSLGETPQEAVAAWN